MNAALDPLFWQQIRSTATEKDAADVLGQFMDDVNAPGPGSEFPRPSPVSNSGLFRRDTRTVCEMEIRNELDLYFVEIFAKVEHKE